MSLMGSREEGGRGIGLTLGPEGTISSNEIFRLNHLLGWMTKQRGLNLLRRIDIRLLTLRRKLGGVSLVIMGHKVLWVWVGHPVHLTMKA